MSFSTLTKDLIWLAATIVLAGAFVALTHGSLLAATSTLQQLLTIE